MRDHERRGRALERHQAARRPRARDEAAIIAGLSAEVDLMLAGGEPPPRTPVPGTPVREAMIEELMDEFERHARLLGTDARDPERRP